MRCERVRHLLLDSQHVRGLIKVRLATYIAPDLEGAGERRDRHIGIRYAQRDAVFEQEIMHQVIEVVLAEDDPTVISIFPHTPPTGWGGQFARIVPDRKRNYQGLAF
jgi:hypothetical protein